MRNLSTSVDDTIAYWKSILDNVKRASQEVATIPTQLQTKINNKLDATIKTATDAYYFVVYLPSNVTAKVESTKRLVKDTADSVANATTKVVTGVNSFFAATSSLYSTSVLVVTEMREEGDIVGVVQRRILPLQSTSANVDPTPFQNAASSTNGPNLVEVTSAVWEGAKGAVFTTVDLAKASVDGAARLKRDMLAAVQWAQSLPVKLQKAKSDAELWYRGLMQRSRELLDGAVSFSRAAWRVVSLQAASEWLAAVRPAMQELSAAAPSERFGALKRLLAVAFAGNQNRTAGAAEAKRQSRLQGRLGSKIPFTEAAPVSTSAHGGRASLTLSGATAGITAAGRGLWGAAAAAKAVVSSAVSGSAQLQEQYQENLRRQGLLKGQVPEQHNQEE